MLSCGVMERVLTWARAESRLNEHVHGKKNCNLTDIPKLDDASNAGGSKSSKCSLIVTEGDSAKALATSGLSVVGRDNFGVFPLRGKLLNVRDATDRQVRGSQIPDAKGTKAYLEVMRAVVDSYLDKSLGVLSRIEKAWFAVFVMRYWRKWILLHPQYDLGKNFITSNAYMCIELNAHALVTILLTIRKTVVG